MRSLSLSASACEGRPPRFALAGGRWVASSPPVALLARSVGCVATVRAMIAVAAERIGARRDVARAPARVVRRRRVAAAVAVARRGAVVGGCRVIGGRRRVARRRVVALRLYVVVRRRRLDRQRRGGDRKRQRRDGDNGTDDTAPDAPGMEAAVTVRGRRGDRQAREREGRSDRENRVLQARHGSLLALWWRD